MRAYSIDLDLGDTLYRITPERAREVIQALSAQLDIPEDVITQAAGLVALAGAVEAMRRTEGHDRACRIVAAGGCNCGTWEDRGQAYLDAGRSIRAHEVAIGCARAAVARARRNG